MFSKWVNILSNKKNIIYVASFLSFFYFTQLNTPLPIWLDSAYSANQIMLDAIAQAPASDIDLFDDNGYTGLMLAALNGNEKEAEAFLARGANPSLTAQKNFNGYTPLHLAIFGADDIPRAPGCFAIIKMLVRRGVPLFVRNQRGEPPLHIVLFLINNVKEKMEIADFLIANGAQVNTRDSFGNTLMHNAVQQNDKQWIIDFRAKYNDFIDPEIKNNKGNTTYQEAQELHFADDLDSVGAALQKELPRLGQGNLGFKEKDNQGRTALMFALYRGNIAEAKKYIAEGADVNAKDNNGRTPLHYAMLSPVPVDSIKCVIDKNPALDVAETVFGNTPLLMVANIEHAADRQVALKVLIAKGANINAKNKKGDTLLDVIKQQAVMGFKDPGLLDAIGNYTKK